MGVPGPNPDSGTYLYGSIDVNRTYMDSFTSEKRSAIFTHECGHVMGLAHNYYFDYRDVWKSIMYSGGSSVYYDQWGLTSPTSKDITDINYLYN